MSSNTATFLNVQMSMNTSSLFSVLIKTSPKGFWSTFCSRWISTTTSKCLILDVFNSDTAADSKVTADSIEFNVSYCRLSLYVKTLSCLDRLLNSHRDSVEEHCKFRFLKHLCMNYSPRWWCADRYQSNNNWTYICSKRVTCDFSWCSKFHQYLNFL